MTITDLIDWPFRTARPGCRCGDITREGLVHATDVPCMWPEDLEIYMARGRWEKALPWMSWEDGWGNYPLWGRCGEKGAPPYDEIALSCQPRRWAIGIDYTSDDYCHSIGVMVGPFQLWFGRTFK